MAFTSRFVQSLVMWLVTTFNFLFNQIFIKPFYFKLGYRKRNIWELM